MTAVRAGLIAPLLLVGVVAAGCGSSSKNSTTSSAAAAGQTTSSSAYGAASTSTAAAAPAPTKSIEVTTKHSKLGMVLAAGPKERTVYLFEADKGGQSACSGACAAAWPPVLGSAKAMGGANSADLGTIKRAGGATQITYKGHPLYWFIKDKDDEDAYGQGLKAFGAEWYVLAPNGNKIDKS
jgi:predicted lipoprotein with Yx(FWY)xxD motif